MVGKSLGCCGAVDSSLGTEQPASNIEISSKEASNTVALNFLIIQLLNLPLHLNNEANADINANLLATGPVTNANRKVAALKG